MSQSESAETAFLAKHPRLIGVLFMLLVLLTQMGAASADFADVTLGP
ncbi:MULTISPECIES: hypothetical protein [unclassified Halorhabdus]|nr:MULTISPECIES: hypothetical protein [unclassified Halorhabdus]